MRRFTPVFCVAVLIAAVAVRAQSTSEAEVTISTDRPAVANSSVVVPQQALQVETGLLATELRSGNILDFPEANFRYGLLDKTELRLSAPDYFHDLSGTAASGLGDLAIGVKQQLGPIGGIDLSIIPFVSLPSGAQGVSSHGYDPGLQLPWSRSVASDWTAGGQLASYWPTQAGKHNFTAEATLFLDRQLSTPCDAFIEYAADFPQVGGSRQLLHFGAAYKLDKRRQVDLHIGIGLTEAAPKAFIGFGYSFLVLRH
jgi:hypothetical protein